MNASQDGERRPRILIVEDDPSIVEVVEFLLRHEGYDVYTANTGSDGLARAAESHPDLALLDMDLGQTTGLAVATRLHQTHPKTAILFLTASASDSDQLAAFAVGADDYITKPFNIPVLVARVNAALRHLNREETPEQHITVGPLQIDTSTRRASANGNPLDLTDAEFDLLTTLARDPHRVVYRDNLIAESHFSGQHDLVEVSLATLRAKIKAVTGARVAHTVRGVGYTLGDVVPLEPVEEPQ